MRKAGFTLIELMIVIAIIAIIAAIAIPNLVEARKNANETSAIAAVKVILNAQTLFREGDKDGDGQNDFASLAELSSTGYLLDDALASGTKGGYHFTSDGAVNGRTVACYVIANPTRLGVTGDRAFATNHGGSLHYTLGLIDTSASNPLVSDGLIPPTLAPVK